MTVRQTVLECTLARTDETLTAHGSLALLAEYSHGLGLRGLVRSGPRAQEARPRPR